MNKRPLTWKQIAEQRREENFVGRTEQIRIFEENFRSEVPQWMVLSVTGEGGVGKSTLLQRYAQMAVSSEINANVVSCDDRHLFPVEVMGAISEQLARVGIVRKEFDDRYKKYLETRQQIESDPLAPRGMVSVITRGVTDFTIKSLRRTPGIGVFADYLDERAAGDALVELAQYAITRWGNKDEVQLVREPEKILTPLFVSLLNEAAEKGPLIIMLDVFERTAGTLSSWLIDLFKCEYGDLAASIFFIVSGRDPLEQHWTELAGLLTHVRLEPFTFEETQQYLSNRNVVDETLVRQIHQDTAGLPVLVELLAGTNPQPGQPLPDVSKDAVERFLQWTPDEAKRRAALLASVPRQFNQELLAALLGDGAPPMFRWLGAQSYIRSDSERGWFYHEKVRELMLRYQHNAAPGDFAQAHRRLAEDFAARQTALSLAVDETYRSEPWRKLEVERVYHALSAAREQGWSQLVQAFLPAFLYRWRFAGHLAHVAEQVVTESRLRPLENRALSLANLLSAFEHDDYDQVVQILNSLQEWIGVHPQTRIAFWSRRGDTYLLMGKYEAALADFDRAIELDDTIAGAIAIRGLTYQQMGKYEAALADFDRAIELDDTMAWAIASRGLTYLQMGKHEAALADFDRAIELADTMAWAIASRGKTYQQMGKYEAALADFDRAIELDDKYAWAIANRGLTNLQMGKYEAALADFDRAIELDDTMAWAIRQRGITYRALRQFEQALADCNHAIELAPEEYSYYYSRGETYRQIGRFAEAVQDFSESLKNGKPDISTFTRRAAAYLAMGNRQAAQQDLEQALSLECEDKGDHYERAVALILSERIPEALEELRIAFTDRSSFIEAQRDDLLDSVRHLPEFQSLMKQAQDAFPATM